MIILHGMWTPGESGASGRFVIWGELPVPDLIPRRRGRLPKKSFGRVLPHPFAAGPPKLRGALRNLAQESGCVEKRIRTTSTQDAILLPTERGAPCPSTGLLDRESRFLQQGARKQSLVAWMVDGLTVGMADLMGLLCALPEVTGDDGRDLIIGHDLRFWSRACKFAMGLLARERLFPGLTGLQDSRTGDGQRARSLWNPCLDDPEDAATMSLLVRSMPAVCLCAVHMSNERYEPPIATSLLENFLSAAVDACVRAWAPDYLARNRGASRTKKLAARTPWEKWAFSLLAPDPYMDLEQKELALLRKGIDAWLEPLHRRRGAFRTCFRLSTPEEPGPEKEGEPGEQWLPQRADARGADDAEQEASSGDEGFSEAVDAQAVPREDLWAVDFLLQAKDDPSLLVPAESIWAAGSDTAVFLNHSLESPQEKLLADLGLAVRLFPPIATALEEACPSGFTLQTEAAYSFLKDGVPLLKESGFGVLVPPWWEKRQARPNLRLKLKPDDDVFESEGKCGLDALVNYDWELSLGGELLSRDDFMHLVAYKVPLVKVRGRWIEIGPEQIREALDFFKRRGELGRVTLAEALRMGLAGEDLNAGTLPVEVVMQGRLAELARKLAQGEKLAEVPSPAGFVGELRPYQARGLSWLDFLTGKGLGACLADDMGLGKTIQLIALLLARKEARGGKARPVLLFCPTSLVGNWRKELERFSPSLQVLVHHGPMRLSGQDFARQARKQDLVISSYALSHRDEEELAKIPWDGVVLDEAQNIKNHSAKQTQAIKRLAHGFRVTLTGTPVENRLSELWSIMDFLNPGFLQSAEAFKTSFAIPIERFRDPQATQHLTRLTKPFILRRLKTDKSIIKDLPDKLEMKVFCNLTREQASLYQAVVEDILERIAAAEGMTRRGLVLSALTRLKQVANHPTHFLGDGSPLKGRSGKLARLTEMTEEVLQEGDRMLVFTQFAEMGELLRRHLQEVFAVEVLFLHGGVPAKARDRMVERFQEEDGGPPIFVLSLKAGGTGLNLTRANHVFHYDRWWNPAVENQATDRAFRIGQSKNVQVHKFLCVGTLEERIDEMIEEKKALAENVLGSGEGWLTELSTDELKDVLGLRPSAISR